MDLIGEATDHLTEDRQFEVSSEPQGRSGLTFVLNVYGPSGLLVMNYPAAQCSTPVQIN